MFCGDEIPLRPLQTTLYITSGLNRFCEYKLVMRQSGQFNKFKSYLLFKRHKSLLMKEICFYYIQPPNTTQSEKLSLPE